MIGSFRMAPAIAGTKYQSSKSPMGLSRALAIRSTTTIEGLRVPRSTSLI